MINWRWYKEVHSSKRCRDMLTRLFWITDCSWGINQFVWTYCFLILSLSITELKDFPHHKLWRKRSLSSQLAKQSPSVRSKQHLCWKWLNTKVKVSSSLRSHRNKNEFAITALTQEITSVMFWTSSSQTWGTGIQRRRMMIITHRLTASWRTWNHWQQRTSTCPISRKQLTK